MKLRLALLVLSFVIAVPVMSQDKKESQSNLPYQQIPAAAEEYSTGSVLARMIDGLGYRYYWATEGLTEEDLSYKPSEDARSMDETISHLYGLSLTIINSPLNIPNVRPKGWDDLSFEERRKRTLKNLEKCSELLGKKDAEAISKLTIIFQNGDQQSEFPFWNMINGPIADALYHTGQVVVMRRSAGNPIDPGVNVFIGKTRGR